MKPLSDHARGILRDMLRRPVPLQEVNAGVYDKLRREGLAKIIPYTSPYAKHKGGVCDHLTLTDAGREEAQK